MANNVNIDVAQSEPVTPRCPHFGQCGGCTLQHLTYTEQLTQKENMLREILQLDAGITRAHIFVHPSTPWGSRHRVQFQFSSAGKIGFMRRQSNEVLELTQCPVLAPVLQKFLNEMQDSAAAQEVQKKIANKEHANFFADSTTLYYHGGPKKICLEIAGKKINFNVDDFFQNNLGLLPQAVQVVTANLQGGLACDLYAGVGLFSAFLEDNFNKVIAVEENKNATAKIKSNTRGKTTSYTETVEAWITGASARAPYNAIILDPPRAGLSPAVTKWLSTKNQVTLSYLSCNPLSFARDLRILTGAGYTITELCALDFYPQTDHLECYARLRKD